MKKPLNLNETRAHLRILGVADSIVESVTQSDLDAFASDTQVPAECPKCDSKHTVGARWAQSAELPRDERGVYITKCARCYL